MRILCAGASGFLGTALRRHLSGQGHEVTQLVRREPSAPQQVQWDPYSGELIPHVLEGADVVVNLAGASIERWPWTPSYKQTLLDSRVASTSTLADSIAASDTKPALVNASGVNYYGDDRGDEELDEFSTVGQGFMTEIVKQWEGATGSARDAGARVAIVRASVVLDQSGGALKVMALPFRFGLGATLGSGRQWFSSLSLRDYIRVLTRLITDSAMDGVFNVTAPQPVTNAEFTRALGQALHRPTLLWAPGFALKTAAGELSNLALGSRRVIPTRLLESGFEFAHPTIDDQLSAAFAD